MACIPLACFSGKGSMKEAANCDGLPETRGRPKPYLTGRPWPLLRQGNWKWSAGVARFETYRRPQHKFQGTPTERALLQEIDARNGHRDEERAPGD